MKFTIAQHGKSNQDIYAFQALHLLFNFKFVSYKSEVEASEQERGWVSREYELFFLVLSGTGSFLFKLPRTE